MSPSTVSTRSGRSSDSIGLTIVKGCCTTIDSDGERGYDIEQPSNDLQKNAGLYHDRGYSESDIEFIFHGNWSNLLKQVWTG